MICSCTDTTGIPDKAETVMFITDQMQVKPDMPDMGSQFNRTLVRKNGLTQGVYNTRIAKAGSG